MSKESKVTATTVKMSEAVDVIHRLWDIDVPVCLWGPPGVGKSALFRQLAERLNMPFIDVRAAMTNPVDHMGFPYRKEGTDEAGLTKPFYWPQVPSIILFDEVNSAPPATQACLYRIMLDQTDAMGRALPKGTRLAAAVNNMTDRGVTYRMPTPLLNRMAHLDVLPDYESWQAWAYPAGVEPVVIQYLNWNKEELHKFNPNSDSKAFPTPRTWEWVSRLLKGYDGHPDDTFFYGVASLVGPGPATKFGEFFRFETELPDIKAIVEGKDASPPKEGNPGVLHLLIGRLLGEMRTTKPEGMSNILKYVYRFPSNEWTMWFIHDAMKMGEVRPRLLMNKTFAEANKKYGYVFTNG